jgi:hypothetical protein
VHEQACVIDPLKDAPRKVNVNDELLHSMEEHLWACPHVRHELPQRKEGELS